MRSGRGGAKAWTFFLQLLQLVVRAYAPVRNPANRCARLRDQGVAGSNPVSRPSEGRVLTEKSKEGAAFSFGHFGDLAPQRTFSRRLAAAVARRVYLKIAERSGRGPHLGSVLAGVGMGSYRLSDPGATVFLYGKAASRSTSIATRERYSACALAIVRVVEVPADNDWKPDG